MKKAYPVILSPSKDGILVKIPDFDAMTSGKDVADAMAMARDLISLLGITLEDDKEPVPAPSELSAIHGKKNDIVTLVDADFAAYRQKYDLRTVKKNCTIPAWLNTEAMRAGINFSAVLQEALKAKLELD